MAKYSTIESSRLDVIEFWGRSKVLDDLDPSELPTLHIQLDEITWQQCRKQVRVSKERSIHEVPYQGGLLGRGKLYRTWSGAASNLSGLHLLV